MRQAGLVAGLLAAALAWPGARGAAQDAGGALAATIMSRLAALPDRRAAFTDSRTLSSLAAPVQSAGTLVFRHPGYLEKLTTEPRAERMVIQGGTLTIAAPGGPPRTVALDAHPALQALATTITATLAGDLASLRRLFAVDATGTPAAWRLALRPAAPALGRFIASVTMDGANADLHSLRIVQANGDTETMSIQPEGGPGR